MESVPTPHAAELLERLSCDLAARPVGAPGFLDLAPALVRRRRPTVLIVEFAPQAAETLAAVVEAERRCCASIDWRIEPPGTPGDTVKLRVQASPAQLDGIEELFSP